jgi:hypothetical protein
MHIELRSAADAARLGENFLDRRQKPTMNKFVAVAVTTWILVACAVRAPQPVAVVQPQDRYADCAAIIAEVQANNTKIQGLASEEGGKVAQNVAAGVVGLFIWPVWFGMDLQGAAGKEVAGLNSRQQYLATLAEQRNCGAPSPPQAAPPVAERLPVATAPPPPVAQPVPAMLPVAPVLAKPIAVPSASDDYEKAGRQYEQAAQQYQRQLELEHAKGR